jgi:Polyketide cyclase / dehydrase and lipid transport
VAVSGSWLAPALTLMTLGTTLGLHFDSNHRVVFVIVTCVIIAATLAIAVRDRINKRGPDWRLVAPLVLGWTSLASESFRSFEAPLLLWVLAGVTYFLGRRERRLAAAAEAASAASFQVVVGFLGFLGAIGGPRMAPLLLIAAAIWLLAWMPSRTRRVHDQDTLHISRPPAEVSAYLLDQRHLPLWYPGYVSSELLEGHGLGAGATFRQVVEPRGHAIEALTTVDEYEPGRRLCSHVMHSPGHGRSCYSFAAEGLGTVATYDFDIEQPYPGALLGSVFFVGDALRKVRALRGHAFEQLKSILEA